MGRPTGVTKTSNEYARSVAMYGAIPKAVFAALAVSFAMRLNEDNQDAANIALFTEWASLHRAGIVKQKPPTARSALGIAGPQPLDGVCGKCGRFTTKGLAHECRRRSGA